MGGSLLLEAFVFRVGRKSRRYAEKSRKFNYDALLSELVIPLAPPPMPGHSSPRGGCDVIASGEALRANGLTEEGDAQESRRLQDVFLMIYVT